MCCAACDQFRSTGITSSIRQCPDCPDGDVVVRFISEVALEYLTIHLNFRKHIRGEIENVCC
jgi:hypothetical protein